MIINAQTYYGFHSVEDLEDTVPALQKLAAARAKALETATTSSERTN